MMINEAVMSGVPTISFPIGVAPDLVQHGVTGALADPLEPGALAQALADVLRWDDQRLAQASAAARLFALRSFTPEMVARAFVQLAEEVRA